MVNLWRVCVAQMAVEAATEHPFFVRGKGWCSSSPERTLRRHGLPCRQLDVGDCCMALSQLVRPPVDADGPLDYSAAGGGASRPAVIRSAGPGSARRSRQRSASESATGHVVSTSTV